VGAASTPITLGSADQRSVEVGGFRVTEADFPGLLRLESHFHERACLAVVLAGGVDKAFPRLGVVLPTATVVTMPAEERHRDLFTSGGARMLVIEPDHRDLGMREKLRPCARVFDEVIALRDEGAADVARRISQELRVLDPVSPLAIDGLALELLARTARAFEPARRPSDPPRWLAQAVDYLHARFSEPVQVDEVATVVGVHPVHLSRTFRRYVGVSVGEYVRRLRIEWAIDTLTACDLPLADVAAEAGFVDQSHFTRAFKRHTGLTPGNYRARLRAK
jgi:AraC family transcriptional regulator